MRIILKSDLAPQIVNSELFARVCIRICVLKNMQIKFAWSQYGGNQMHISDIANFTHSKNLDNMMEKFQQPPD